MTPRFESFVVNRLIVLRKARHASFYFSGLKSCKLLILKRQTQQINWRAPHPSCGSSLKQNSAKNEAIGDGIVNSFV